MLACYKLFAAEEKMHVVIGLQVYVQARCVLCSTHAENSIGNTAGMHTQDEHISMRFCSGI